MHDTIHTITSGGIEAPDNSSAPSGCCRAATPADRAECAPSPAEITVDATTETLAPAATIAHLAPGDRVLVMVDPQVQEPEVRLLMDSLGQAFPGVRFVASSVIHGAMILPAERTPDPDSTAALPHLRALSNAVSTHLKSAPTSVTQEQGIAYRPTLATQEQSIAYRALADVHNGVVAFLNSQEV